MEIIALLILKTKQGDEDPIILAKTLDLSRFSFWTRNNVREVVIFASRTVAKRSSPGQRFSVQHGEFKVHAYNKDGVCTLGFMDDHYPVRSAFTLLNQVLDEYYKEFGDSWKNINSDNTNSWPYLDGAISKLSTRFLLFNILIEWNIHTMQDPTEVDKLLKIEKDLMETKIMLHQTIESVLARGEKLDNLVQKSSDLSFASQTFYRQTKGVDQCCATL